MNPRLLVRFLSVIGVIILAMSGTASAADARVMISAGFYNAHSELAPAFERASGHRLVTTRGPSMGDSLESIPTRLARSEAEIGFQQVSELIRVEGVTFVGTIPAELQPGFALVGALTSTVQQPEAASALIRFVASPEAAPAVAKAGLLPPSPR